MGDGCGLRVLLVDDNDDLREAVRMMIECWGHDVTDVACGAEGVAVALRDRPQVALVDIGMPGMDGYECARRIRAGLRSTEEGGGTGPLRLLAMTGHGEDSDRRRALEAGFDLHLVKPIPLEQLRLELARTAALAR